MILNYLRARNATLGSRLLPGCSFIRHNTQTATNLVESSQREAKRPEEKFPLSNNACQKAEVVPREVPEILPFDQVPGPRLLKYIALGRRYLSDVGTQITARALTAAFNIGTAYPWKNSHRHLKYLFDEYGPVVRFISPLGGDIVLTNNPKHIAAIYAQEGQYPVRSTLDSLHKFRNRRFYSVMSPFSGQNDEWVRQRSLVSMPLNSAAMKYSYELWNSCDDLTEKIYAIKNTQDELPTDLHAEIHKWAFDCLGHITLSKKMSTIYNEVLAGTSDPRYLYGALLETTVALERCESGFHMWKLFDTPAFLNLVENCENLENLIGKQVHAVEQSEDDGIDSDVESPSLISIILKGENMSTQDVVTIIMDILLIGVNATASATSFLLYNLARSPRSQKEVMSEMSNAARFIDSEDVASLSENTPYLQACIKETLRLVPPMPLLTRILPKSIVLDNFNIPRGTLVIMSTQDSGLKESNFEDSTRFVPERWLRPDAKDYDAFASIPFGYGPRKCLGKGVAETAMTMLAIKLLQKYKLEYHYGDIYPTSTFIVKPSKPLKIRFADRH